MASAAVNRFPVLSHEEVSRFYPPGTRVEIDSSLKAGKVDSYDGDGWIWVAEIPGNDLRMRKTYDLNPCISRGMWVLVRSKHALNRPYKIARITETSAKNRTVAVKHLSGFSQVLSRPCIREIIPFNSSHADLVARLTGSEIPAAVLASATPASADPEAEEREPEPVEEEVPPPKLKHVTDKEGKSYTYLLYSDGKIGWPGFEGLIEENDLDPDRFKHTADGEVRFDAFDEAPDSPQGKRNAPAAELQTSQKKKKSRVNNL